MFSTILAATPRIGLVWARWRPAVPDRRRGRRRSRGGGRRGGRPAAGVGADSDGGLRRRTDGVRRCRSGRGCGCRAVLSRPAVFVAGAPAARRRPRWPRPVVDGSARGPGGSRRRSRARRSRRWSGRRGSAGTSPRRSTHSDRNPPVGFLRSLLGRHGRSRLSTRCALNAVSWVQCPWCKVADRTNQHSVVNLLRLRVQASFARTGCAGCCTSHRASVAPRRTRDHAYEISRLRSVAVPITVARTAYAIITMTPSHHMNETPSNDVR